MCVILTLPAGVNIDEDKLENAVANNWHGYGIVLKDEVAKRIEVRQGFSEDNGADPEEVARILKDNDDVTRYVHLRHTTKGSNGLDNCHPFTVYHSGNRHVLMMHNGTMPHKFHPKVGDERSDTRVFAEEFVSDLLLRFNGDLGHGDYNYPMIKTILEEFAGYQNKLLFVSNDLEPLYCNHWSLIKNKDGSSFRASNDTYFDKIVRGPLHKALPFRHSTTTVTPATRPPYGTNLKTNESGGATASGTSTSGALTLVPRSPEASEQKTEEKATTTGAALVNEAKSSRVLVALKDVEDYSKPMPYAPPKALIQALGTSEKMFLDFGFDSLCWVSDSELQQALKSISPYALSELFRNLIESASGLAEDVDVAQDRIEQLEREVAILEGKHDAATKMIATLKNPVEQLKKVG